MVLGRKRPGRLPAPDLAGAGPRHRGSDIDNLSVRRAACGAEPRTRPGRPPVRALGPDQPPRGPGAGSIIYRPSRARVRLFKHLGGAAADRGWSSTSSGVLPQVGSNKRSQAAHARPAAMPSSSWRERCAWGAAAQKARQAATSRWPSGGLPPLRSGPTVLVFTDMCVFLRRAGRGCGLARLFHLRAGGLLRERRSGSALKLRGQTAGVRAPSSCCSRGAVSFSEGSSSRGSSRLAARLAAGAYRAASSVTDVASRASRHTEKQKGKERRCGSLLCTRKVTPVTGWALRHLVFHGLADQGGRLDLLLQFACKAVAQAGRPGPSGGVTARIEGVRHPPATNG